MEHSKVSLIDVIKEYSAPGNKKVRAVDTISLDIRGGEFFALLGPSGCGKTTTLRLIAGFEQPDSGTILIDGVAMQGVPPYLRPVNTVFQDYALFPHMTVEQNVLFGLEMEHVNRKEALRRTQEALELVRLPQIGRRRPRELSGGQQQRVALARAIAKRPSVLLLDEPLGALDLKLRREMQLELKSMQQELGITFIFVTHDQEEAMTMADRIAVMNGGHVLQVGQPDEIYETPHTRFVADFIGETNFISGNVVAQEHDEAVIQLGAEQVIRSRINGADLQASKPITIALRPERIMIRSSNEDAPQSESRLNTTEGTVLQSYYIGTDMRYVVKLPAGDQVTVRVQNTAYERERVLSRNQPVKLYWRIENTTVLTE